MQVTRLATYPVKSLGGVTPDRSVVTPHGLDGDRRWLVTDTDGRALSTLRCHALMSLTATPLPDGGVRLATRDGDSLDVAPPAPDAERMAVSTRRDDALPLAAPEASAWLSAHLDRPVRLLHQPDPAARSISTKHGGRPGETLSLADTGPLLLVTEASVQRLRDWVLETAQEEWVDQDEAVARFRPNVVVDGDEPFAEDGWRHVSIGGVPFRATMVCDRCVMTTIDRVDLTTWKEPIRTLARHRRWDGATWFGIRLTPVLPVAAGAVLRVGDEVVAG